MPAFYRDGISYLRETIQNNKGAFYIFEGVCPAMVHVSGDDINCCRLENKRESAKI